ncbi:hypothetical protein FOQG_07641 [Fusarium oxysporum f. sp. raphani 54005]|uniref:Uncharacterized protein n=3 Tax=Fusarium oxysporum TaxID=5507 RepID=X0D4G1_FUSOX|nr:hypothetical protein FOVG_12149 [Fusarium oxysporum f. sp. pisi HDV247]EXK89547.1 hypothetical protein FOQG_07641 [Fusarium oxysporum f. sp. raphani 54005]EXM22061.1 hypothetical protein FOTG_10340 [Fusarium oxysporum f. sp. vasinfectum 25433]
MSTLRRLRIFGAFELLSLPITHEPDMELVDRDGGQFNS